MSCEWEVAQNLPEPSRQSYMYTLHITSQASAPKSHRRARAKQGSRKMSSDWQRPPPGYDLDGLVGEGALRAPVGKSPHAAVLEATRLVQEALPS